jgi:hypothetical protein
MEAEQRAGVVMFSCLSRIENAVAGGAMSKWMEVIEWEDAQAEAAAAGSALSEIENFKAQIEREKREKAGRVMIRCLNRICNSVYLGGWARWRQVIIDHTRAGEVLNR